MLLRIERIHDEDVCLKPTRAAHQRFQYADNGPVTAVAEFQSGGWQLTPQCGFDDGIRKRRAKPVEMFAPFLRPLPVEVVRALWCQVATVRKPRLSSIEDGIRAKFLPG